MDPWMTKLCGLCHCPPPLGFELFLTSSSLPELRFCKPCWERIRKWEELEKQGIGRIRVKWCRGCGLPRRIYFQLYKKNGRPKKCL